MKQIAAFDFDGTCVKKDTFFPFLLQQEQHVKKCLLTLFHLRSLTRRGWKEALFTAFFQNTSVASFHEAATRFWQENLEHLLRTDVMSLLYQEKAAGKTIVVVSANLELFLSMLPKSFPLDVLIATKAEVKSGHLTGKLLGPNCRGAEKVKRFQEVFGETAAYHLTYYGDSRGDREMIQLAHKGVWV